MPDSVGTSDSAGSSGASCSSPGSSGTAPDSGLRVDFYVLEASSSEARLRLACRLAEKAYLAAQTALVWHTDEAELQAFDELLWTFMDGSFVPHDRLTASTAAPQSPVLLSCAQHPPRNVDILINLAADLPECLGMTQRVAEIIDGDESRRKAGRTRFKAYRDMGLQPASHNIRAD